MVKLFFLSLVFFKLISHLADFYKKKTILLIG